MFEERIERLEEEIVTLRKLEKLPELPFDGRLEYHALVIEDFKNIKPAKDFLREHLGLTSWTLQQRWFSCGSFLTSWKNSVNDYRIWLEIFKLEDYPKKLQGPNCNWDRTQAKGESSAFTCKL